MPRRRVHLLAAWAFVVSGVAVFAADRPAISLLDRDSLVGWDLLPSRGWQVRDGALQADVDATPLVAGWTFGDFELMFRWSAAKPARVTLGFTDARRDGDGAELLALSLAEGEGCGRLVHADEILAKGGKLEATASGWHETRLRRQGDAMSLIIDDRSIDDVATRIADRLGLRLVVDGGPAALAEIRIIEPAGEAIFNARDLTGWWTPGKIDGWQAQDGKLVCLNKDGNYLRTEREFGNFVLSFEYRMAQGGNSGIGIRTARAGWPSGDGMELQLLDEPSTAPLTRHSTMAIYGNLVPLTRADRSREWNRVAIRAEERVISAWVNGTLAQFADTTRLPELHRRHLKGWIGLQDHGARIEFRDLKVWELPERTAPPCPAEVIRSGSEWVLDRLMNPRRLALDDGLGSRTVQKSVERAGEHVLAELTGPGAIVEIWHRGGAGQWAFYFDGEAAPRIDGPAAELHLHAPQVGQDQQPLLTYLPFRRSLKIVAQATGEAEYRFDYVAFPAEMALETFHGGESGVARGLLPALSYRNEQLGWGTHREADPLPRKSSPPQTIAPGESKELSRLEGSGVVEWTKLQCPAAVLANDDLWLEVRYGGQSRPAVSAPVRYFFPGLTGGNYPNYVVVDRGGFTSMLAMPYREGLTISVVNQGREPIDSIAATVSFAPTAKGASNEFFLHGVFARGEQGASRGLVKLAGRGRLVGLVRQWKGGSTSPCDSLIVDGQARDGGQAADGNSVLDAADAQSEFRRSLSGRHGGLMWRFFWLAPVDFTESLELPGSAAGDRLLLVYLNDPLRH
ncbi:MAG TPA: family 16 glycoside hydrolase [Pirellulales bacterium]|nr:family 16 glycoside hydrolase [Pirellulales bacterium]